VLEIVKKNLSEDINNKGNVLLWIFKNEFVESNGDKLWSFSQLKILTAKSVLKLELYGTRLERLTRDKHYSYYESP